MPHKNKRDCPVCDQPGLQYIGVIIYVKYIIIYADERKKWLGRVGFSISHKHCSSLLPGRPTHTVKEMRCVRKKTCSVLKPTAFMVTKPCPEFKFRHKFSLFVMGPTQSGKTYFVQQILKHNRIVYEEKKSIRIFWYYNQWQECYEEVKT